MKSNIGKSDWGTSGGGRLFIELMSSFVSASTATGIFGPKISNGVRAKTDSTSWWMSRWNFDMFASSSSASRWTRFSLKINYENVKYSGDLNNKLLWAHFDSWRHMHMFDWFDYIKTSPVLVQTFSEIGKLEWLKFEWQILNGKIWTYEYEWHNT